MLHPTIRHFAVMVVAGVSCCFAAVGRAQAGELIPVATGEVCDAQCEEPCPSCCDALCRKLRLHCIYVRKACHRRYIALPYTDPTSIMYHAPGLSAAGGDPMFPPTGAPYCYPGSYGSGNAGYAPQPIARYPMYAAPGSNLIR